MKEKYKQQISITEQAEEAADKLLEHLSAQGVDDQTFGAAVVHFESLDSCKKIEYVAALTKSNDGSQQSTDKIDSAEEKKQRRLHNLSLLGSTAKAMYQIRRNVSTNRFNTAKGG